jgi:hypothetical protein
MLTRNDLERLGLGILGGIPRLRLFYLAFDSEHRGGIFVYRDMFAIKWVVSTPKAIAYITFANPNRKHISWLRTVMNPVAEPFVHFKTQVLTILEESLICLGWPAKHIFEEANPTQRRPSFLEFELYLLRAMSEDDGLHRILSLVMDLGSVGLFKGSFNAVDVMLRQCGTDGSERLVIVLLLVEELFISLVLGILPIGDKVP